ncbi:hypothetical protein [Reinekea marinisedimentorum]|uniref:Uncharacterized protein n=1 Tax=Reinekea marinisedimentorum TaxID=230495 RepID=A0A4R3IEP1_9GAMM|nr:hypothetical protein [Reinekea marinisedimentorum]TCS44078.1 hypothetical protein BCF53_101421 [Reinekea marinisedimentorum]
MKYLYIPVVVLTCAMLGASLVLMDSGATQNALICVTLAMVGFVTAYRLQARYLLLDEV